MARVPSDIRFPPGSVVDHDELFDRILRLKETVYPGHTARDLADPFIQLLSLVCALEAHGLGMVNNALLQLSPYTATSRRSLISMLALFNRPLRPIQPSRGPILARVMKSAQAGDTLTSLGQRMAAVGFSDPVFTPDEDIVYPTDDSLVPLLYTDSDQAVTSLGGVAPWSIEVDVLDAVIVEADTLAFDSIDFTFATPFNVDDVELCWEYRNSEYGPVDSVTDNGSSIRFVVNTYLNSDRLGASSSPVGLRVTVRYKPTGVGYASVVELDGSDLVVDTTLLGQSSVSESVTDYEIFAEWLPIPEVVDGTTGLSEDGIVSWDITKLFNDSTRWLRDPNSGKFSVRARIVEAGSVSFPFTLEVSALTTDTVDGNRWIVVNCTQGVRGAVNLGNTDGSQFQAMVLPSELIDEPFVTPAFGLSVGGDESWSVVSDFSDTDNTSKHAVVIEDPDDGWSLVFGDGVLGVLPAEGESVKLTYRSSSTEPGDLSSGTTFRIVSGVKLIDTITLFKGSTGFEAAEASDRASALRYKAQVLPQLALRQDSAVTDAEIVTALTGGAPNRATFTTSDGRKPFTRALFTTVGTAIRQYRVMVVGARSSPTGEVSSLDTREAELWLNGVPVGVQLVGGHGPINTEGVVSQFTARYLLPTVTITMPNITGGRELADSIVREFFKPHATLPNGEYRWQFGGRIPVPNLFADLWGGIPNRTFIEIEIQDGVTTLTTGDSLTLGLTELPVLDPSYDPLVNIVMVVG